MAAKAKRKVSRRDAEDAVRTLLRWAGEDPEREGLLETKRNALKALPVDRYPHLVEAADAMTDCEDIDGYYEFGVDMFVAGARATLAAKG